MKKDVLICIILALCAIAFFSFNLGSLSFLKGDENYYFQVARRMLRVDDWLTPRYHHHIRFEKPPLYYWLVAGTFKLLGVSWSAARFSSVALGTFTLIIIYLLALEFFGRRAALFSFMALATNEMFFRYSRLCVSDIAFLCFISLALFLFVKGRKSESGACFILSFIPMGLAALTKGPVGMMLVILIGLAFLNYRGSTSVVNIRNAALGTLLFLAVTLPWVIAMALTHKGAFLQHIWSVEIVGKALTPAKGAASFIEKAWQYIRSFGYYVPVVIFSFLPWSIFLPFALLAKKDAEVREGNLFILSWFWTVFIFFSVAGFKHTHYMLALSPALAMIVGTYLAGLSKRRPSFKKVPVIVGALSVVFFLTLTGVIFPYIDDGALRAFSLKLANEIKKNNEIGMASRQFNIKKLGIHLNNLVSTPYELSGDDLARYVYIDKSTNLVPFLRSKKRVFVLITKEDYLKYVPLELRRSSLYILERHNIWKKPKFEKEFFRSILRGDLDQLKEEAYLVSNRK